MLVIHCDCGYVYCKKWNKCLFLSVARMVLWTRLAIFFWEQVLCIQPKLITCAGVEDSSTISGGGVTSNAWATQQWTFAWGYLLQRKSTYNTLPPIIIGSVENGFPLNIRFLSFRMIFNLHDYGRKGNWMRFSQWCVVCWLKALILFQGLPTTFFSIFVLFFVFWKCGSHKTGWLNLSSCCSSKHLPWYLQRCW